MPKRLGTGDPPWLRPCAIPQLTTCVNLEAGFTLLELLVVLAIMVLAVTAFPIALDRALPGRRVRAATERLEAEIRHAEIQSIAQDRPQRLSVAELASQFSASTQVDAAGPGGRPLQTLVIYPDGSTTGARLVVSDGSVRSIVAVSEITGRISVDDR